jgi:hypothetical protein
MNIKYNFHDVVSGYIGNEDTYIITSYKNDDKMIYKLEFDLFYDNTIYWFNNDEYCAILQSIMDWLKNKGSKIISNNNNRYELIAISIHNNNDITFIANIYNHLHINDNISVSYDIDNNIDAIYCMNNYINEIEEYININIDKPIEIFNDNSIPYPNNLN